MRLRAKIFCLILCLVLCATAAHADELSKRTLRWVFDLEESAASNADLPAMGLDIPRSAVRSVTFLSTVAYAPDDAVDYSANHNGYVRAWAEPCGDLYDVYVAADGGVIANPNSSYLFYGCSSLTEVNFNESFDTANVTAMVSMFENCESLEKLDLSDLDLSRVEDVSFMFYGCPQLKPPMMRQMDFDSVITHSMFSDRTLVCVTCGGEFIFPADQRLMYVDMGFQNEPARCPECREARREQSAATAAPRQMTETICSRCGQIIQVPFVPRGDRPVYCSDCFNSLRG